MKLAYLDNNKIALPLIPVGKSSNLGIEGFTPYMNWSMNYHIFGDINRMVTDFEGSTLRAKNNLLLVQRTY